MPALPEKALRNRPIYRTARKTPQQRAGLKKNALADDDRFWCARGTVMEAVRRSTDD